ncbi:GNAT family N-acetyltransferase [Nitrospirillum iridis]|uniref:Ribosomal protein S18 acetylase RimI-like enzyme n=1 Tax=Nitrospirillum iridis TaxID=765888 RepID=A0A7X0AUX7_9PROT|nr:GNAT family N-acetyltransferase [Nitrospirillum iridis]MBB6250550.1 ribosomal protein S18 acetylase RimI-like enzyme [Nitrospirillum iridis]
MPWRPMAAIDLPAVFTLACAIHVDHFEALEVMADKLAAYPAGCLVLDGTDGGVNGYAISHPYGKGRVPKLNHLLGGLPADADIYYIHDVAIAPAARGQGQAEAVVAMLAGHARDAGFTEMRLLSVNNTMAFWSRKGFTAIHIASLDVSSYGADAVYMGKSL